jgi:hypothetical protein
MWYNWQEGIKYLPYNLEYEKGKYLLIKSKTSPVSCNMERNVWNFKFLIFYKNNTRTHTKKFYTELKEDMLTYVNQTVREYVHVLKLKNMFCDAMKIDAMCKQP